MKLAVVLVNWRNEDETLRCARAVLGWRALDAALIVVDNRSTESSHRRLAAVLAPDQIIASTHNLGYGGGNNLGIARALAGSCEAILLLNSDVEIDEATVTRLAARLRANPGLAILGPAIEERSAPGTHILVGGRDIARHALTRIAVVPDRLRDLPGYPLHAVDYVSGTVFLARRAVFEAVGLLDERYFFSGEIADFCQRARSHGFLAAVDLETLAIHETRHATASRRDTLYAYYSLRNRFLYVSQHYKAERMRLIAYWAVQGLAQAARALLRGQPARARALFLAVAHGCTARYGNRNDAFELA